MKGVLLKHFIIQYSTIEPVAYIALGIGPVAPDLSDKPECYVLRISSEHLAIIRHVSAPLIETTLVSDRKNSPSSLQKGPVKPFETIQEIKDWLKNSSHEYKLSQIRKIFGA